VHVIVRRFAARLGEGNTRWLAVCAARARHARSSYDAASVLHHGTRPREAPPPPSPSAARAHEQWLEDTFDAALFETQQGRVLRFVRAEARAGAGAVLVLAKSRTPVAADEVIAPVAALVYRLVSQRCACFSSTRRCKVRMAKSRRSARGPRASPSRRSPSHVRRLMAAHGQREPTNPRSRSHPSWRRSPTNSRRRVLSCQLRQGLVSRHGLMQGLGCQHKSSCRCSRTSESRYPKRAAYMCKLG